MDNKDSVFYKDKIIDGVTVSNTSGVGVAVKGKYLAECVGPDGELKWEENYDNIVVDEGINHILDTEFHGSAQITTWYVGLKGEGAGAAEDTLASHSAWSEVSDYTGDRKEFVEGGASSKSISNSGNAASFSINDTCTISGSFLCSAESGSSGVLMSVGDFDHVRYLYSGDTLAVTWTLTGADA